MSKHNLLSIMSVIAVLLSGAGDASATGGSCLIPDPHHACRLPADIGEVRWSAACDGQAVRQTARMSVIAEARLQEERLLLCPSADAESLSSTSEPR